MSLDFALGQHQWRMVTVTRSFQPIWANQNALHDMLDKISVCKGGTYPAQLVLQNLG